MWIRLASRHCIIMFNVALEGRRGVVHRATAAPARPPHTALAGLRCNRKNSLPE